MGIFQKIGKGISHAAKQVGHVVSTNVRGLGRTNEQLLKAVGPGLDLIPGVGPVVHGALNASASVMAGHNLKHTAGEALKGVGSGIVAGGLGKIGSLASKIPGAGAVQDAVSHIPGVSQIGSGIKQIGSDIGQYIPHGPDLGQSAETAGMGGFNIGDAATGALQKIGGLNGVLGIGAAYEGIKDKQRQAQLEKQGLGTLQGERNNNAQVRDAGRANLLQGPPNLDDVFADPGNAYYRPLQRVGK